MERECPYIETSHKDLACGASLSNMVPGVSEFAAYCETEDHDRCPILLARVLRESSLTRPQRASSAFCR